MRLVHINSREDLNSKVATNSIGRIGIISGIQEFEWGTSYVGIGVDGKGTWAGMEVCVIAETTTEYHDKLLKRFNGKLSQNG